MGKSQWKTEKPVKCVELNLKFKSIRDANRHMVKYGYKPEYNIGHMTKYISKCCKGEIETAYGFHWEFVEQSMKQIFIEFVVPDIVYDEYERILIDFEQSLVKIHGLTDDSLQVREFTIDEIPF